MQSQHSIEEETRQPVGMVVPLELANLRIVRQEMQADGTLRIEVIGTNDRASCPHCGVISVKQHDIRPRCKRDIPVRDHQVQVILYKRRYWCMNCHKAFTESDSACGYRRRTTVRLREAIGTQACRRPMAHVAAEYQVGPRFVQECFETVASQQLAKRGLSMDETAPLPTPRFLGIDEFARRKGHRYDTILCDLEKRHVLEVSAGRKQEEVEKLLERLKDCDAVQVVSMDMSNVFRGAVQLCLPKARIVADHFHIIQHVNKALAKVLSRLANSEVGKKALKGQRYLFLRNKEDLSESEEQTRASLAQTFPELGMAWQHKENLRTWYTTATKATAAADLDVWVAQVKLSGPAELREALSAFRDWRQEILAFIDWLPLRLSNGFVEGKNNRTKTLMRQGYGYRNRGHLRLRILLEEEVA